MKYFLVTGASSGIGRSITEHLSGSEKNIIYACDINKEKLEEINKVNVIPVKMDVTDGKSIKIAFSKISKTTQHLDIIINNAGIGSMDSLIEGDMSSFEKVIDVNLFGMVRVNKIMFPLLSKKSRIINISSECGWMTAAPFNGPYTMSKYAVESYNDSLRRELNFLGIKVIKIQPGSFKTAMHDATINNLNNLKEKTVLYKKVVKNLGKMTISSLKDASDMKYMLEVVDKAIYDETPKICYRVKNSKSRTIMNMLSETTVDELFLKYLK